MGKIVPHVFSLSPAHLFSNESVNHTTDWRFGLSSNDRVLNGENQLC